LRTEGALVISTLFRSFSAPALAFALLAINAAAPAQQPGSAPAAAANIAAGGETVESDPIRCWLKTTKTAVHIGEQFNLAMTCAIVETSRVAVVPDLSQVEPSTIQLAPFEVIGGTRHPDIRAGMWRYLQFEYTLRLIADSFFGQDLSIPSLTIKYTVQVSDGGVAQQGREKSYVLPAMPVRIISLVPQSASDIRDASRETFADIEARAFRGTAAYVAAAIAFSFAAILLLVAIAKLFQRYSGKIIVREPSLSPAAISVGCLGVLRQAASQAATQGWTPELVGEALSTLRIAAALALKAPVTQVCVALDVPAREGQLTLRKGVLRPRRFLVSTPLTPFSIARSGGSIHESMKPFVDALRIFTEARYGRDKEPDNAALSSLAQATCESLQALRWRLAWPFQATSNLIEGVTARWRLVWAR
jgi:hypothetical protein